MGQQHSRIILTLLFLIFFLFSILLALKHYFRIYSITNTMSPSIFAGLPNDLIMTIIKMNTEAIKRDKQIADTKERSDINIEYLQHHFTAFPTARNNWPTYFKDVYSTIQYDIFFLWQRDTTSPHEIFLTPDQKQKEKNLYNLISDKYDDDMMFDETYEDIVETLMMSSDAECTDTEEEEETDEE